METTYDKQTGKKRAIISEAEGRRGRVFIAFLYQEASSGWKFEDMKEFAEKAAAQTFVDRWLAK